MSSPVQQSLSLCPKDTCPHCGRKWTGILEAGTVDLAAIQKLSQEDFYSIIRCTIGACRSTNNPNSEA